MIQCIQAWNFSNELSINYNVKIDSPHDKIWIWLDIICRDTDLSRSWFKSTVF